LGAGEDGVTHPFFIQRLLQLLTLVQSAKFLHKGTLGLGAIFLWLAFDLAQYAS
jgi:alanine-alpha-ketoisovalerate/valine-pyruvate aminotransferase